MSEGVLRAWSIGVTGPHGPLLEGVSLEATAGRVLAVTGSSGSGKTTLLSVLGGLAKSRAGEVTNTAEPGTHAA